MKYAALDFEVGNANLTSACSVGLSLFEDFRLVRRSGGLIRPPFSAGPFHWGNVRVHGIARKDVEHAPMFDERWGELAGDLEDSIIVCHNAAFDTSVLCACLDHFRLPYPRCRYLCTVKVSKAVWPEMENHRLNTLAEALGIRLEHHESGSDAYAAGMLLLAALRETGCQDAEQLAGRLGIRLGVLGGTACMTEQERRKAKRPQRGYPRRRHGSRPASDGDHPPAANELSRKGDHYDERLLDRTAKH